MSRIAGGCLCGAVKYTCAAEPVMVALCQCTHCQRQSGSAFSVNVGIPKGSLQVTAGKTAVFQDTGSSGQPVYRHFCGACGSPIFSDVVFDAAARLAQGRHARRHLVGQAGGQRVVRVGAALGRLSRGRRALRAKPAGRAVRPVAWPTIRDARR